MSRKLTKLELRIKAENQRFEKLPKQQQRIEIAQDVLAQLRAKKFVAQQGTYVSVDNLLKAGQNESIDLSVPLTQAESCTVCGIGGLFVSAVCKADKLSVEEADGVDLGGNFDMAGDIAYAYLKQFFSQEQLELIECAFEGEPSFQELADSGDVYDAVEFTEGVEDDDTRLRLIMENIIVNKGRFVPSKKPVQIWLTKGFDKIQSS